MKSVVLMLLILLVEIPASFGQGTLYFSNKHGKVDAPVYYDFVGRTGMRLLGSHYVAQLYAGATIETLAPIGDPAPFYSGDASSAGYWNSSNPYRVVNSIEPGFTAFAKVVVWDMNIASNYEDAVVKGMGAESPVFEVRTGGDGVTPTLPTDLVGLTPFALALPEPPSVLLGLLGLALALVVRPSR